jgi:oligopeptide/dipeptide ABC transporter ATP-binding protein
MSDTATTADSAATEAGKASTTGGSSSPLLNVQDVSVSFSIGRGRRGTEVRALDHVDLTVGQGEIVGLVGESGSGKSTLARVVCGLQSSASGGVFFDGAQLPRRRTKEQRRAVQMVFQDPYASLDPRMTVGQVLKELLRFHGIVARSEVKARSSELMDLVQLPAALMDSTPSGMSGGQRQRVAIARALALEPRLLVADEAVAALDVSVQAGVVNLMVDLREQLNLSILFIAHDLAVVRSLCDRVSVIYLGRIVEEGSVGRIFDAPQHPYTQGLLAAVPRIDGSRAASTAPPGEAQLDMTTAPGCQFAPRCPSVVDLCSHERPRLRSCEQPVPDHRAACHLVGTAPGTAP